ncbi:MAG: RNA polymerase sigma factor [Bacteroidetes bacterium]|nr:RNA polymerase sigma factor [Bacteroidota bacterium]MBP7400173.1 RNA polymerase sigma factor [Chitinophagales bacterium]MBK7110773.1 RNA polymerase sigma factor [Bacteroidota bacterium]MBK8488007.1 RNA polymerase sigma factor [Bacteroidota bacterium]MBK8682235.1 RNA polymerase sigma factor [Bacteroidota bacterium]
MSKLTITKNSSDEILIQYSINGDRSAQKAIFDKYSSRLMGVCMRYAVDQPAAEDILQEGFIKAFKNLSKFRNEGSFEGWLRRIMVNTAIEIYRKKNHLYPVLEIETQTERVTYDNVLSDLAAEDIMHMVMNLSPGYRTVFNLYAVEGYSHKEIAEQLNISEGTSKSQLARARYILMKKVEELTGVQRRAIGQ